jgi:general secretion pathway protein N
MTLNIKRWQWILLGLLSYIAFLIAYFPAVYVADFVNTQSKGEVRLASVSGTLFNGRAQRLEAQGFQINNLEWSLNPLALFALKANVDLRGGAIRNPEQIYVNGNVSVSLLAPKEVSLEDTQLFLPAKSVLSQFKLPVAVTASGRFRVDIANLEMTPTCTTLNANGAWINAQVDTPQAPVNLGNFEADMSCSNGELSVNILPGNSLQLKAQVLVGVDGKYQASGEFKPTEELPDVIQQAADSFFAKNAEGFYQLRL